MAKSIELSTVEARKQVIALRDAAAHLGKVLGNVETGLRKTQKASLDQSASIHKQINSISGAVKQFESMRTILKGVGADSIHLANLSRAAKKLGNDLGQFTVSGKNARTSINQWTEALQRAAKAANATQNATQKARMEQQRHARAMKAGTVGLMRWHSTTGKVGRGAAVAEGKTRGLSKQMRNLGSSAVFAVGPLSGIGARLSAFSAVAARSGLFIAAAALGGTRRRATAAARLPDRAMASVRTG